MHNQNYFKSPLYPLANQEIDWLPMDDEERYEHNLKTNKTLLEKYNWIGKKFTYRFNSDGFRSEEFEGDQDCVVFLGCSHTMGIGVPNDTVWTSLVAASLGLKCYNLGIGGASNDTAFRLGYHYIPKLKPKLVVLLVPDQDRFELFDRHRNFFQYGPWCADHFYKQWSLMEANSYLNKLKNTLALTAVCNSINAKFINFDSNAIKVVDLARDLGHFGIESHRMFSQQVLNSL
jgi:hypothetical protein